MDTKQVTKEELEKLYDTDYPLWVQVNIELLKDGAYELVDWDNLLEEIQDMGARHLDACISYLAVILEHLYKLDNFKKIAGGDTAGNSWRQSIDYSRVEIETLFDRYPSLRKKLPENMEYAWRYAKRKLEKWLKYNGYNPSDFAIPEKVPYSFEEAMSREV